MQPTPLFPPFFSRPEGDCDIAIYIALGGTNQSINQSIDRSINQSINQSISDVYRVRATVSHGWGSCRRVSPEVARWDGCQGVCALKVGRGEKRWTGFPPGERNHET